MTYILRAWGYSYAAGEEEYSLGYVTKLGHISKNKRDAHTFASEADAWLYASNAELVGHDEKGEWCFPEELHEQNCTKLLSYLCRNWPQRQLVGQEEVQKM